MMMLRAVFAFVSLPVLVAGLLPWFVSRLPSERWPVSPLGMVPLAVGLMVLMSAVVSFYRRGHGTLAPWDPPQKLVVEDLYRFNRNPMYVAVILILFGWALLGGSPWIYGYVVLVAVVFHLRVVVYEEKEMARLFGKDWDEYRASVPRWGIRLK